MRLVGADTRWSLVPCCYDNTADTIYGAAMGRWVYNIARVERAVRVCERYAKRRNRCGMTDAHPKCCRRWGTRNILHTDGSWKWWGIGIDHNKNSTIKKIHEWKREKEETGGSLACHRASIKPTSTVSYPNIDINRWKTGELQKHGTLFLATKNT